MHTRLGVGVRVETCYCGVFGLFIGGAGLVNSGRCGPERDGVVSCFCVEFGYFSIASKSGLKFLFLKKISPESAALVGCFRRIGVSMLWLSKLCHCSVDRGGGRCASPNREVFRWENVFEEASAEQRLSC